MSKKFIFISLMLLAAGSLMTLAYGEIAWEKVWITLLSRLNGSSDDWNPFLDERLPRLIVLLCSGASLAVSGAVMQALFYNPLAAPGIIGLNCGGSLFAICAMIFQWHYFFPFAVPAAAATGCFATLFIVYGLSKMQGVLLSQSLILTGIAVATLLLAVQTTLLFALRNRWELIRMIAEWEAGSSYDRSWMHVNMQLPLAIIGMFGCLYYRTELNLLSLGEEEAKGLGVSVPKVRWRLFLCISLLTGGTLASMGNIPFFGLLMPHLIRKIAGFDHRTLIPFCLICGALSLLFLDLGIRFFEITAFSIGNISALLGGFIFLLLLIRSQKEAVYG